MTVNLRHTERNCLRDNEILLDIRQSVAINCAARLDVSTRRARQYCKVCAPAVVYTRKYDSMRKELYHFLRRTKKIYTIYLGIARAYTIHILAWSLIFVEQRVSSFTRSNELYFSCVCSQWQSRPDRASARLSPLDANKSRNSDAPRVHADSAFVDGI